MRDEKETAAGRRDFLRKVGIGTVGVGATLATPLMTPAHADSETDQEKRKFVERVDFISSPGFLDGSEGARERAGLPPDTGPHRVVTPWALYDYTAERKLRLIARAPWVNVDQILEQCEYPPVVAKEIGVLEGPTEEELHILRTELDPRGQNTAERSAWVVFDGETYTRAEG